MISYLSWPTFCCSLLLFSSSGPNLLHFSTDLCHQFLIWKFLRELLEWFLMSYTDGLIVYWRLHMTLQLVAVGLWFVSFIGSLVNFLTLVYIGVIFILSVPLVYDKFQHQIDEKLSVADRTIQEQFRKIDETVLSRLPFFSNKEKKMQ